MLQGRQFLGFQRGASAVSTSEPVSHPSAKVSEKLAAILKICQQMNSARNLLPLLDLIAREATRLVEADRASIFLLDREKQELWSTVALGSLETLRFDARLGIAGAVIETGELVNVDEAHHHPRFYPGIDAHTGYRTHSLLAVPLRNLQGEIVGVFEVLNKQGGVFTETDQEILGALAAQAAIAIETAQMFEDLRGHRDQLLQENTQLWREVEDRFAARNILGRSDVIQRVVRLIHAISETSVDVLITGETGTGKELAAKAIHYDSSRARRPFVPLNCAALPDSLVESELFGIEEGVATGVRRRIGKFEAANTGMLFLDEVGDLSLTTQAKLLRVLQERVVEHVGGRKGIPVDVQVVAATNKNLEREIAEGTFRPDLYYRLNVIQVRMPALREIRDDIPLLANSFLAKYCRQMQRDLMTLTADGLRCLTNYSWPGNVRELENEVKRLVVSASGTSITAQDVSEAIRRGEGGNVPPSPGPMKATIAELERRMILEALKGCRYNQRQAAKVLGLSRQGLIKKMKRFAITAT
jgi:Nif-specific regulatory protein